MDNNDIKYRQRRTCKWCGKKWQMLVSHDWEIVFRSVDKRVPPCLFCEGGNTECAIEVLDGAKRIR